MADKDDKPSSTTQILDKIALKAGIEDKDREALKQTIRDNSAAGRDYKALKAYLLDLLKQALKSIKTYILLAISAYLAEINDLINVVD